MAEIGVMLRKMRLDARMTQQQLAELLDVSHQYISEVERGKYSPSWRYLVCFANALGANILTLLRAVGLVSPDTAVVEQEIAALLEESPELADLIEAARILLDNDARELAALVDFARYKARRILDQG